MNPGERAFHEHFLAPGRTGALPGAQCTGEAENLICGDWVRFHARCEGERLLEVSVQVRGCSAVIACASLAAEALQGLDFASARSLDVAALAKARGAKARDLAHAPSVVTRALESTLASRGFDCQASME